MIIATVPPACSACGGLTPSLLPIASRRKPFAYYLCRWCNYTWIAPKGSVELISQPISRADRRT